MVKRSDTINFLNKELREKALVNNASAIGAQNSVNVAKAVAIAAKVRRAKVELPNVLQPVTPDPDPKTPQPNPVNPPKPTP